MILRWMNDEMNNHPPENRMQTPQKKPKPASRRKVRKDQLFAIGVIEKIFGGLAEADPGLWVERTFLTMVVKVYEYLVMHQDITPREMIDLAKAFTENCKLDRASRGGGLTTLQGRKLLDGLEEAIQRLYGVNLPCDQTRSTKSPGDVPQVSA